VTEAGPRSSDPVVQLSRATKRFGAVTAVDEVSVSVRRGEFFSLLGPSGCGKTTTLRLVAGLEEPDEGEVRLLGRVVNGRRPYERPVAMVFQNYALFPHLDVRRNVAFGLEQRRVPADRIRERVRRALELVRLDPDIYGERSPAQLSGGQRQRVALARALVIEPAILLLDEPLGAIDLKLRKEMQLELKALNRHLGITFLYVTHDQEEALTMSDRIAVMNDARVAQVGTPAEIYENPRTAFVADFIGECNFFAGTVGGRSGTFATVVRDDGLRFRIPGADGVGSGRRVRIAVRPEWHDVWRPEEAPPDENAIPGVVRDVVYLGETVHVIVRLADGSDARIALRNEGQLIKPVPWRAGDDVSVGWRPEDCQVLEDG